MTASLQAWVRMLDGPRAPKSAWLFELMTRRKPRRLELAAWLRWLNMKTRKDGGRLDRKVQCVMLHPGPGAA